MLVPQRMSKPWKAHQVAPPAFRKYLEMDVETFCAKGTDTDLAVRFLFKKAEQRCKAYVLKAKKIY